DGKPDQELPKLRPAFVNAAEPIHRVIEPRTDRVSHKSDVVVGPSRDALQEAVDLRVIGGRHDVIDRRRDRSGIARHHGPRVQWCSWRGRWRRLSWKWWRCRN